MAKTFAFSCPATNTNVHHWLDGDNNVSDHEYEVITCPSCTKLHFMNRKTGKLWDDLCDEELKPWMGGP